MTGRRLAALLAFDLAALLVVALLVGLSAWQVQRRAWKLDLIARVETRVHAPAMPAPGPASWPHISVSDEYRRVSVAGTWLGAPPALVQASTERGGGYWVLAPLLCDDGTTVLVNRGFVPADRRDPAMWRSLPGRREEVSGLLRLTEPRGTLLRSNDPAADRWYSRDVAAIAASRGLAEVAPYFIDAEAGPSKDTLPAGGLTVVAFSNNHLVYALIWAGLALMAAGGAIIVNLEMMGARLRMRRSESP